MKSILFSLLVGSLAFVACKNENCIDPDGIDYNVNCGSGYNPVCGCDDETYQNACYAERSGVTVWIEGPCP